jgi:hypothetical protein
MRSLLLEVERLNIDRGWPIDDVSLRSVCVLTGTNAKVIPGNVGGKEMQGEATAYLAAMLPR